MLKPNEVPEDAEFVEVASSRRGQTKHVLPIDDFPLQETAEPVLSEEQAPNVPEVTEDRSVSIVVDQAAKKVTATFQGKVLVERNVGDWFIPNSFQVNAPGLKKAWLTKFKESLPEDIQISFSFNGGFSMGQRSNPRTVDGIKTLMEQRLTGKKVGPGKRKKKRK